MYINITELLRLKETLADLHSSIKNNLSGIGNEISAINSNLVSSSLSKANGEMLSRVTSLSTTIETNLARLIEFLSDQISKYQITNDEAKAELESLVNLISETFGENGAVLATVSVTAIGASSTEAVIPEVANPLDLSVYSSNPEKGFVVTTGNPTFELSEADQDLMYAVVAAESDQSYDDALAVASVILNRCSTPNWVRSFGDTPAQQMTAPSQFSVYKSPGVGSYAKYTGGNAPDTVKKAVEDALNGVRNCSYLSFRSNRTTSYGSNMITSSGNRYN